MKIELPFCTKPMPSYEDFLVKEMRFFAIQSIPAPSEYYPFSKDYVGFIKEIQTEKQKPTSAKERRARRRRIKKMMQSEINRMAGTAWMGGV
jgi:hypothetical protein